MSMTWSLANHCSILFQFSCGQQACRHVTKTSEASPVRRSCCFHLCIGGDKQTVDRTSKVLLLFVAVLPTSHAQFQVLLLQFASIEYECLSDKGVKIQGVIQIVSEQRRAQSPIPNKSIRAQGHE
jgi:hypothetical protein